MAHHAYGHPYDPNCPHCKPEMLHAVTGEVLGDDHPSMKILMRVWHAAPFEERRAYIAVSADNSRDPRDLASMAPLLERIQAAMRASKAN